MVKTLPEMIVVVGAGTLPFWMSTPTTIEPKTIFAPSAKKFESTCAVAASFFIFSGSVDDFEFFLFHPTKLVFCRNGEKVVARGDEDALFELAALIGEELAAV